ncbi:uncharacterized protein At1g51745 [Ricinus communis]|uniref:PWWP domain-containing protein n=1 Tax=Ricinus communis TaxID=3988 RepID=B9S1Y8_RICCO|nr:uncharacterized protein At1g51745 [Ricinus communis]EEF42331.1 conserved hypothetical protein [Ricinus communis]|eukprot:XP_002520007.1 uncharacterized protein At1g51745 [Ricinus communis]
MGSWGSGAVDYGIGPIVWVRRRNGSWWPGKILEPDELAECNLTSPRTGTPVKLLGREDASVDWYNLEKSKRVKAFRCGEFDDCIERAESAQGMPIKKREKYARREDAILHALELEKELLRKQGNLSASTDQPRSKSSGSAKNVIASEGNSGKPGNAKLNQFLNRVEMNIKNETVSNFLKPKDENQPISEDDHSEATPRMRGLQDFGLRTTSLKRKNASPVDSDGSEKHMVDNHFQAHPVGATSMAKVNHANGGDQMGGVSRAKRSKCVYFPAETNDSLDDKELPPNQIKMFGNDGHPHRGSLNEQNSSSGFTEDVESDSSQTDSSESESDSTETEPDVDDEMTVYKDAGVHSEAEQDVLRQPERQEHESTSSEEPDELAFSGDIRHLYPDDPFLSNEAVSKWQLKGKRNIRHLAKKSVDGADGKVLNGPVHGTYRGKGSTFAQRGYGVDDSDFDRDYFGAQIIGVDYGRYSCNPRFMSRGRSTGRNVIDWRDLTWEDRPAFKGRWEDRAEHFNPMIFGRHHFGGRTRSMLLDVDLKVQASYQKEPVPIVSLMSKLNGKAIIGHPIQIEALEDGSSEAVISTNDYCSNEAVDYDGNASLPPAWRTARRTNFRVPRPHLSSVLGDEDVAVDHAFVDQEGRLPFKKSSVSRKSVPHISWPPMDRKFPRKLSKKASLSSNQKTRTLSSIAVQQSFGAKTLHYTSGSQMDGLIKPETAGPTTVACIPVKLVFSRLLEKINRPPSKAACKVVMSNREAERQPS